ncbi:MAG TPA: hypothetical protein VLX85_12170 [Stellaceae bacterium]|nr:hypothetical protein [Stellaceae bacterium]
MTMAKTFIVVASGLLVAIVVGFFALREVQTPPETHGQPTAAAAPGEAPVPAAPAVAPFPPVPQNADPRAERQALFAEMREGYAQAAPDAPNLLDLLSDRFPGDLDSVVNEVTASPLPSPATAQRVLAKAFVTIQARDGKKLGEAPGAALRQFMAAQRDLLIAAAANGTVSCTAVSRAPTPEIARLSIVRLYSLLAAIADGRDHPVPRPAASKDDYVAFAQRAVDRGVDVSRWKGVSDPATAPAHVCQALISMYDAAVKTEGPLGERILAAFAQDQLTTSIAVYQPVLK